MKYNLRELLNTQYKFYVKIWCNVTVNVRTETGVFLFNTNRGEWVDYSEYSKIADKKDYEVGVISKRIDENGLILQTIIEGVWDEV